MKQIAPKKRALLLACKELEHVRRPGKLAEYLVAKGYHVDVQCFTKDTKVDSSHIEFTEIRHVSRLEILHDKYLRFKKRDEGAYTENPTLRGKVLNALVFPLFWILSLGGILLKWLSPDLYAKAHSKFIERLKLSFRRAKYLNFTKAGEAIVKAKKYKYDLIICHDVYPLAYAVSLKEQHEARLWFDIVDHPFYRSYMDVKALEVPSASEKATFLRNMLKSDFITTALKKIPEFDLGNIPLETISNFHTKQSYNETVKPVSRPKAPAFIMAGNHFKSTGVLRALAFIENYPEPCSLDIIGRFNRAAHEAEVLSAIKEKGLEAHVTLRPRLSPKALHQELLGKTAVLIPFDSTHPNLNNLLPNRLFDAMRAKLPVLAQAGTATGDWISAQGVGIATDFSDPQAAIKSAQDYLSQADPSRQAFSRVNETFNWETEISKLDKFF